MQNKVEGKSAELLPCPFCGGNPEWINLAHPSGIPAIQCNECQFSMQQDRRDKTIFYWNRRAHRNQPPAPVEGERLDEFIICAANYYQDGLQHPHQPKNISNGFVTCGRRHHNCIGTFAEIVGFPYSDAALVIQNTEVQGFLTNKNLFVDRKEAFQIARKANQIYGPNKGQQENSIGLTSEDLY